MISFRNKRAVGRVLYFLMITTLTGCVDVTQKMTVESADKAVFQFEMSASAALLALALDQDKSEFCHPSHETRNDIDVLTETFTEKGDRICRITATAPLDTLVTAIQQRRLLPAQAPERAKDVFDLSIEKQSDGVYRFVMSITGPKDALPPESNPFANAALAMMLKSLDGRSFSGSITAPKIVKTNARLSDDKKTTTWSVPMADLMTKPGTKFVFDVTFEVPSGFWARIKSWF